MSDLLIDKVLDVEAIFSRERDQRPSDFLEKIKCPFCFGNEDETPPTINSIINDKGEWIVRDFSNKYPAVSGKGKIKGAQDVICDSADHTQCLSSLGVEEIFNWLFLIQKRFLQLQERIPKIKQMFFFKNHGKNAGATLKHPHTQVVGINYISNRYRRFLYSLEIFYNERKKCFICQKQENKRIMQNSYFSCIVPDVPFLNYETWILPEKHTSKFQYCEQKTLVYLAEILKAMIKRINKKLNYPDYNLVLMNGLNDVRNEHFFHWFIRILPRTSYLAGFEFATGINIHSVSPAQAFKDLKHVDI